MKKLTNSDIDLRLKDRKYKKEEINKKLKDRKIEISGIYVNISTPAKFRCLKDGCGYEWETSPNCVINGPKTGCSRCSGKERLTDKIIDSRISHRNIKRIGHYTGRTKSKIVFKCKTCGYEWEARVDGILSGKGCHRCAGNIQLTNEMIDQRLPDRIKRIGNYVNNVTKISFECEMCFRKWKTSPTCIINYETGCPNCKTGKNERLVKRVLERFGINHEPQKNIKEIISEETRNLRFDFYLPEHLTAIEYDGAQHFKPTAFAGMSKSEAEIKFEYIKECDLYKNAFCERNSICLIRIDGRKYINSKLEKYLNEQIIPCLIKNV